MMLGGEKKRVAIYLHPSFVICGPTLSSRFQLGIKHTHETFSSRSHLLIHWIAVDLDAESRDKNHLPICFIGFRLQSLLHSWIVIKSRSAINATLANYRVWSPSANNYDLCNLNTACAMLAIPAYRRVYTKFGQIWLFLAIIVSHHCKADALLQTSSTSC